MSDLLIGWSAAGKVTEEVFNKVAHENTIWLLGLESTGDRPMTRILVLLAMLSLTCPLLHVRAEHALSAGADVTAFADRVADNDWHPAIMAALAERSSGGAVFIPAGQYRVDQPIELQGQTVLLLAPGARLFTGGQDLIRVVGDGDITIRGLGGRPELANTATNLQRDERGVPAETVTSVISLNHVPMDARPSLRVEGMTLTGFVCIEGMRVEEKGPMGALEVLDCHLQAEDIHLSHRHSEVESLRVENSLFTGTARYGIYAASPMPGGAIVRGNVLRDVGIRAIQLSGGYVNMIADGAVNYLPSAIVHDNQILGGGHLAKVTTSYIMGILVYGHNVSVQNNIVRDFNRGESVPGEPVGHRIKRPDGEYYRDIWIETEDNPRKRLAGAAIYTKARQCIISGNICTNSGWRSVIEIKTGGVEPYAIISNNIVDGRSLAIEDSFGFECGSARAMWNGNLVYNMPDIAFAVRGGGRQNTYMNNAIFGAKTGFAVAPGSSGREEWIANNRFEDVETPVSAVHDYRGAARTHAPPPLLVPRQQALPAPADALRGQIAVLLDPTGDRVLICKRVADAYVWADLHSGEIAGGLLVQGGKLVRIGNELAANPDQSADGPPGEDAGPRSWSLTGAADRFPFGWSASAPGVDVERVMVYDRDTAETGERSLRIGDGDETFNWVLTQRVPVAPGRLYLAEARVRADAPELPFSLYMVLDDERVASADVPTEDWTTVSLLVRIPEDGPEQASVRLWGSGAGAGKHVWIDHFSMAEVEFGEQQAQSR